MKRDRSGCWVLEHPKDYLEFTHRGVHFKRITTLHEAGEYIATVTRSGRTYRVTGGHSKRHPWCAFDSRGAPLWPGSGCATLIEAAGRLAWHDADVRDLQTLNT